jgi:hypothetical protein
MKYLLQQEPIKILNTARPKAQGQLTTINEIARYTAY